MSLHLCSVCLHQWRIPQFALKYPCNLPPSPPPRGRPFTRYRGRFQGLWALGCPSRTNEGITGPRVASPGKPGAGAPHAPNSQAAAGRGTCLRVRTCQCRAVPLCKSAAEVTFAVRRLFGCLTQHSCFPAILGGPNLLKASKVSRAATLHRNLSCRGSVWTTEASHSRT